MALDQSSSSGYWEGVSNAAERQAAAQAIADEVAALEAAQKSSSAPNLTVTGPAENSLVGPPSPLSSGSSRPSDSLAQPSLGSQPAAQASTDDYPEGPLPSALNMLPSTPSALNMPMSDAEKLVTQEYAKLGRAGFGTDETSIDQPGFDYWKGQLSSGQMTPEQFVTAFDKAAAMPKTPEQIAASTYGIYGRAGLGTEQNQIDPAGYNYWTGELKSGAVTPEDFAKRISYDLSKDTKFNGDVSGLDVHNYFYEHKDNPYQVAEYASSKGLTGADISRATGLNQDQVQDYFKPVFSPLDQLIDKPGRGVGGQYGNVNGMPILSRGILDQLIDSDISARGAGSNVIAGGDKVNEDNALGWDTASDNAQYARGNAAFGVERHAGGMGRREEISGDLIGLAKAFNVDPNDPRFMRTQTSQFGPPVEELDKGALYDALSEKTKDYYRVAGAVGNAPADSAAINRPDISGNHASILYKSYGDKLVPMGDPTYYDASYKVKSNALQTVAMAIPMFFPGVGQAIGAALNLSGTAASVVGNALFNAGVTALAGGDPLKGAITGGAGAFAQSVAGPVAENVLGAGNKVVGAARIEEIAKLANIPIERVENAISASLSNALSAAVLGGQDPLKTFGVSLAASFIAPEVKNKVKEFASSLDSGAFNKAATYAAGAAESVANSVISGGNIAENLVSDLSGTYKDVDDHFKTQVGADIAGYDPSGKMQYGDMFGKADTDVVVNEFKGTRGENGLMGPSENSNNPVQGQFVERTLPDGSKLTYAQLYDQKTKKYEYHVIEGGNLGGTQATYSRIVDGVPDAITQDEATRLNLDIPSDRSNTVFKKTEDAPTETKKPEESGGINLGLINLGGATGATSGAVGCASTVTSGGLPPSYPSGTTSTTGGKCVAPTNTTGGLPSVTGSATQPGGALPTVTVTGGKDVTPSLPPITVIGGPEVTPSLPGVCVIGEDCTPSLPPIIVQPPIVSLPPIIVEPPIDEPPICEPPEEEEKKKKKKEKEEDKPVIPTVGGSPIPFEWLDSRAELLNTRGGIETGPLGAAVIKPVKYAQGGLSFATGDSVDLQSVSEVCKDAPKFHDCKTPESLQTTGARKKTLLMPSELRQILPQISSQGNMGGMASGGLPHKYEKAAPDGHNPEFITGLTGYYADGGGTGQSDDIPAMLHDGDYVMDAETVSSLGDGSSKAGRKVLDGFRNQVPHKDVAEGKVVPAKIADGEYVFPAAFVTALGGGDNRRGADILDGLREKLRAHKRAAPLDKIPPKAKSPLAYIGKTKG